jgi:hypothetical protein
MKKIPASASAGYPLDLTMAVHVNPGVTYEWSKVLLARASFNGRFELLTTAWERLLGYERQEFSAKTLGQLMMSGEAAATVAAILDHQSMEPVDLTLCCRNGKRKSLRLHRRFDEYADRMFILAEETREPALRAQRPALLVDRVGPVPALEPLGELLFVGAPGERIGGPDRTR